MSLKKVKTQDGSFTYYNSKYEEHYHSIAGAEEEAIEKYAIPTNVAKIATKGDLKILDVCFGLGYNSAAVIDVAKKANKNVSIKIVALENDLEIIKRIQLNETSFKSYALIQKLSKNMKISIDKVTADLIIGDAVETIKDINDTFDVILFDPFSPPKCPALWTESFFLDILNVMKQGSVLATYSCARKVRDNLQAVGFDVKDGPSVGRRSPSTLAYKL